MSNANSNNLEKPPFLRGLSWKLTLAFVVVVLSAWFVTFLILGMFDYYNLRQSLADKTNFAEASAATNDIAELLPPENLNRAALKFWLENYRLQINLRYQKAAPSFFYYYESLFEPLDNSVALILLDENQQMIIADHPRYAASFEFDPTESQRFAAAKNGENDAAKLMSQNENGAVSSVVPVRAADGDFRGALLVREQPLFTPSGAIFKLVSDYLNDTKEGVWYLILFGFLFGFPVARYLTLRLNRIGLAAQSWSGGDFSTQAKDDSRDELGILAGRLNRMAEELKKTFALKQELAASEERNRIARDLHDSVKQQVFGLAMQISAAQRLIEHDKSAAGARLLEAKKLAHSVQTELVSLIKELRPMPENGGDFAEHLETYAADWARQNAIEITIEINRNIVVSAAIQTTFFRIVQEALANIARHSRAKTVALSLAADAENITLIVTDDGSGFDPKTIAHGFGLQNMRERAAALPAGQLKIESAAGKGTRLIVNCRRSAEEN